MATLRTIAPVASIACVAAACGPPTPIPPQTDARPAHSGHHEEHGPRVHRFERAADWVPLFDDPARDEWQRPRDVVAALGVGEGMTVADVGAGTGYFEPHLSRAVGASGVVVAVDVEPDMVRYLAERARREHLPNVRAALSTPDDPGLAKASVDRVLVVDTWHHVPDRPRFAAKLREALRPGGQILIVDFRPDARRGPPAHHRLSASDIARDLEAAGLTARVVEPALPEQSMVLAR